MSFEVTLIAVGTTKPFTAEIVRRLARRAAKEGMNDGAEIAVTLGRFATPHAARRFATAVGGCQEHEPGDAIHPGTRPMLEKALAGDATLLKTISAGFQGSAFALDTLMSDAVALGSGGFRLYLIT